MEKVGLYFGSFNPVHIGHMAVAGYMKEFTDLDRIWFVVSPLNPLKKKDSLLADHHRLYLVELAIGENDSMMACDIEFRLPAPSYTIDTLTRLSEQYPHFSFVLIMGEDNLYTLHKWKNALELAGRYPMYVFPRQGVRKRKNQTLDLILSKSSITWVDAPEIEISGTFIRDGIKAGKDMSYFLHPPVWKYILDMNFYRK